MLDGRPTEARAAADWFGNHSYFKSHGRSVTRNDARAQGIVVTDLEDDGVLQDLVLSVSHAAQVTFGSTPCVKLIENHRGRCYLSLEGPQIIFGAAVGAAPAGPWPAVRGVAPPRRGQDPGCASCCGGDLSRNVGCADNRETSPATSLRRPAAPAGAPAQPRTLPLPCLPRTVGGGR